MTSFTDPLHILDLAQTRAALAIASLDGEQLDLPTPCDAWSVRDVINKLIASTLLFASLGRREQGDPRLDLIHPKEMLGNDPLGAYSAAATSCRDAWRVPGALDGMATSTIGEAKAHSVLNARIFDTTILSWDITVATSLPCLVDAEQGTYVLRVAKALVPAVRSHNKERYKEPVAIKEDASILEQLIAVTGRDPQWKPKPT